jgi:hypothetical protein
MVDLPGDLTVELSDVTEMLTDLLPARVLFSAIKSFEYSSQTAGIGRNFKQSTFTSFPCSKNKNICKD